MSATVTHLPGLRGANLEAFHRAGEIVEAGMRPGEAPVVYVTCPACQGTRVLVHAIDRCSYCNGRGYIVTEQT